MSLQCGLIHIQRAVGYLCTTSAFHLHLWGHSIVLGILTIHLSLKYEKWNNVKTSHLGQKACILLRRYSWSRGTVWTGMGCQGSWGSHTWGPAGGNSPEYAQCIDCSTAVNVEYNIFHLYRQASQGEGASIQSIVEHRLDLRGCTVPSWALCPRPCSWPPASRAGSQPPASPGTGPGATAAGHCQLIHIRCYNIQLARIRMALSFSSISESRLHQFQLSLWPSCRGGPEDSKTPPNCKVWIILSRVMALPKKQCFRILYFEQTWISTGFFVIFNFLWIASTWLKIIQTLQVGAVLESTGPPLPDGHRDIWNWCTLGWEIDETRVPFL